uniref:Mitochondrial transcription rescue factor 1 C-terminal domain-containing protein n=1 Tax=Anopheles atroparvus TaxID=41427 RepID=A0A182JKX1_ANOAO
LFSHYTTINTYAVNQRNPESERLVPVPRTIWMTMMRSKTREMRMMICLVIRVNGKKLVKKSAQLDVNDEIDVVREPSPTNPDHLVVSRVEIVSVTPQAENFAVVLRRHKSLTIENYSEGSYGSSKDK